jgi:hypothetical protein
MLPQQKATRRAILDHRNAGQNTDRTDRVFHHKTEIPANHYISTRSISGRYLWERSIPYHPRVIAGLTTAREEVLQTGTLTRVRAMRSVL